MGQALNRVLREALDAFLGHFDTRDEQLRKQLRDLQERVEFIERGYRPRQVPKEVKAVSKGVPGHLLGKAVIIVKALLGEVGVGKSADDLAKPLGLSRSSSGRTVRAIRKAMPKIITYNKSGNYLLYWIEGTDEEQARAWLSEQSAQAQASPGPVNGVAVLTEVEGRFVLTLPTEKVYRASRARDLKLKAKKWGYSVDDRMEASEPKTERPFAPVAKLRSV